MSDACIICECEAVDTEEWFFNKKIHEFVCPWCIKDMHKIKELVKTHDGSDYHTRQLFNQIQQLLEEKS